MGERNMLLKVVENNNDDDNRSRVNDVPLDALGGENLFRSDG